MGHQALDYDADNSKYVYEDPVSLTCGDTL